MFQNKKESNGKSDEIDKSNNPVSEMQLCEICSGCGVQCKANGAEKGLEKVQYNHKVRERLAKTHCICVRH